MTVIAFGAAKSAPGVTTTTLALAARWPTDREPLVVEADPSGGDLVAWLTSLDGGNGGLRDTPSTVQMAASSRSGLSERSLLEHLQRLPGPGEVRVLVAPSSPFAASTAMATLAPARLGDLLTRLTGFDVLVDVGRIDATTPALAVLHELGSVVLVTRPTLSSVLHTRELVASLRSAGIRSSLIIIGDRPYSPAEVADAIGAVTVLGTLPDDPVGARALRGEARNAKVLGRTRLVRSAAELAVHLVPPATPAPSAAPPAAVPTSRPLPDHYWAPIPPVITPEDAAAASNRSNVGSNGSSAGQVAS